MKINYVHSNTSFRLLKRFFLSPNIWISYIHDSTTSLKIRFCEDFEKTFTENSHGYSQKSFERSYTPYYTKDYCNNLPKPVNHI